MIDWLVFSRDRGMQLDLLLQSHKALAAPLTDTLTVLYEATTGEHERGYRLTQERHSFARLAPEIRFEGDVWTWLRGAGPLVGFLCDDDVWLHAPPPVPAHVGWQPFLYRLGYNTVVQHPTGGVRQSLPRDVHRVEYRPDVAPAIAWSWHGSEGDWGYPFTLDGGVYRRDTVLELLGMSARFADPTTLEAGVASVVADMPESMPSQLYAFEHSCLVSIPHNRVTVNSHNPIMADGRGVDELLRLYLAGHRIDYQRTRRLVPRVDAAHVEAPYVVGL